MTRFVAFLRGINVGGRVVEKERLRQVFASMGFQNVSTYKQSGNVIFEAKTTNPEEVRTELEEKLGSVLGYSINIFIRTLTQLKSIINQDPFAGSKREGASFLVTFISAAPNPFPLPLPLTIPKSTAQVIAAVGTEVFSVTHGGGEGALPNPFLESKLKTKATTRNINTLREIMEKFG